MYHWELRKHLDALKGARLHVLTNLMLHMNTHWRAWPKEKTIAKEIGYDIGTISGALKELETIGAIVEVPYSERIGKKELALHNRRTVYQLTGALEHNGEIVPYLVLPNNPEAIQTILAELDGLNAKVHFGKIPTWENPLPIEDIPEEIEGIPLKDSSPSGEALQDESDKPNVTDDNILLNWVKGEASDYMEGFAESLVETVSGKPNDEMDYAREYQKLVRFFPLARVPIDKLRQSATPEGLAREDMDEWLMTGVTGRYIPEIVNPCIDESGHEDGSIWRITDFGRYVLEQVGKPGIDWSPLTPAESKHAIEVARKYHLECQHLSAEATLHSGEKTPRHTCNNPLSLTNVAVCEGCRNYEPPTRFHHVPKVDKSQEIASYTDNILITFNADNPPTPPTSLSIGGGQDETMALINQALAEVGVVPIRERVKVTVTDLITRRAEEYQGDLSITFNAAPPTPPAEISGTDGQNQAQTPPIVASRNNSLPEWCTKRVVSILAQVYNEGRYAPSPHITGDKMTVFKLISHGYLADTGNPLQPRYTITETGRAFCEAQPKVMAAIEDYKAASAKSKAQPKLPRKAKVKNDFPTEIAEPAVQAIAEALAQACYQGTFASCEPGTRKRIGAVAWQYHYTGHDSETVSMVKRFFDGQEKPWTNCQPEAYLKHIDSAKAWQNGNRSAAIPEVGGASGIEIYGQDEIEDESE